VGVHEPPAWLLKAEHQPLVDLPEPEFLHHGQRFPDVLQHVGQQELRDAASGQGQGGPAGAGPQSLQIADQVDPGQRHGIQIHPAGHDVAAATHVHPDLRLRHGSPQSLRALVLRKWK
jgi:hypothetical protein